MDETCDSEGGGYLVVPPPGQPNEPAAVLHTTHIFKVRVVGSAPSLGRHHDDFLGFGQHVPKDGIPLPPLGVIERGRAMKTAKVGDVVVCLVVERGKETERDRRLDPLR